MKKMSLLIVAVVSLLHAQLSFDFVNAPWVDVTPNAWSDSEDKKIVITNNSKKTIRLESFRLAIPNAPDTVMSLGEFGYNLRGKVSLFEQNDTLMILDIFLTGNGMENRVIIPAGKSRVFTIGARNCTGRDWTPSIIHYSVNSPGISHEGILEAGSVKLSSIPQLIAHPDFYNESFYVPDTVGIRGGAAGGFIDTWVNQENGESYTQAQINFLAEDTYMTVHGVSSKFRPDLMGTRQSPDGKGPMYAMSMIAVQELFNIDMQVMMAVSAHESRAALESFESQGEYSNGIDYGRTLFGKNSSTNLGFINLIETSYKGYIYEGFTSYFTNISGLSDEIFKTPQVKNSDKSDSYCAGNSAQMVSTAFVSALYFNYWYSLVSTSEDWDYDSLITAARDKEMAAKMFLWAFDEGWGGFWKDLLKNDEVLLDSDIMERCPAYVQKVYQILPELEEASKNSVLNGGTCHVYDDSISLEKMAEFLFGMNTTLEGEVTGTSVELGEQGRFGYGGLLKFFPLSESEQISIWQDVVTAFNVMKGKAPSVSGENISLRYDFLTIVRLVKGYLDLETPLPVDLEFDTFVISNSKTKPSIISSPVFAEVKQASADKDMVVKVVPSPLDSVVEFYHTTDTAWGDFFSVTGINTGNHLEYTIDKSTLHGDSIWIVVRSSLGGEVIAKYSTDISAVSINKLSSKKICPNVISLKHRILSLDIPFTGIESNVSVSLMDFRGRIIKSLELRQPGEGSIVETMDLSSVAMGRYIVQVKTAQWKVAKVIAVQ